MEKTVAKGAARSSFDSYSVVFFCCLLMDSEETCFLSFFLIRECKKFCQSRATKNSGSPERFS